MRRITDVNEARKLPEVANPFFERKEWIDEDTGITHAEDVVRPLVPRPVDGDQILFFVDRDGRAMEVVYTETGPAKTVLRV